MKLSVNCHREEWREYGKDAKGKPVEMLIRAISVVDMERLRHHVYGRTITQRIKKGGRIENVVDIIKDWRFTAGKAMLALQDARNLVVVIEDDATASALGDALKSPVEQGRFSLDGKLSSEVKGLLFGDEENPNRKLVFWVNEQHDSIAGMSDDDEDEEALAKN